MGFFDWLFGERKRRATQQDLDAELEHWRIAKIMNPDGVRVIARVRLRRPNLPDLAKYTTAVSISWPFAGEIASEEVTAAMDRLEIALEDLEDFSYLIQVRTGLGERNWLHYTSDAQRFETVLRSRIASHGWPVTIEIRKDPNWSEWRLLVDRIKGTAAEHH